MLLDKFLKYVKYDTQSNKNSPTCPSSNGQLVLAEVLKQELKDLGVSDVIVDEYGYVYANLDGDNTLPTIGLLAHMDTSDAASGLNVNPTIINNYDGNDIELNDEITTSLERFPKLKNYVGKTLVVTDGKTLLGADDKAGIAIIMQLLEDLINNPFEHGPIKVCFTPDEEIGRGIDKFNYDLFEVDFAYTLDGDLPNYIAYENFNAASAVVTTKGVSVHPGDAKDKLINAMKLAIEFNSLLDQDKVPEKTEGYEGFNHLTNIEGEVLTCRLDYIIRNHDIAKLNEQKQDFLAIQKQMNDKYGYDCVNVELIDEYRNMIEHFKDNTYPIDLVKEAMNNLNMHFKSVAIRGGTDGANLTNNGILCPNLGTGGQFYHGVHELWCVEDGLIVLDLVKEILRIARK